MPGARFLLLVFLFCLSSVDAQRWARKKNKNTDKVVDTEEQEVNPSTYGNFEARQAAEASPKRRNRRDPRAAPDMADLMKMMGGDGAGGASGMADLMKMMGGADGGDGGEGMAALMKGLGDLENMDLGTIMQQGMGMWKEMLGSPEMQEMMNNPDQMRELMTPFVEMMGGDKSKLEEMLADPGNLKKSMNEGIDAMQELMSDPNKIQELADSMMETLDPATKEKIQKLASGDEAALNEMMAEVDPSGELSTLLSDPSKLNDPASLQKIQEALGLSGDQLMEKLSARSGGSNSESTNAGINLGDLNGGINS